MNARRLAVAVALAAVALAGAAAVLAGQPRSGGKPRCGAVCVATALRGTFVRPAGRRQTLPPPHRPRRHPLLNRIKQNKVVSAAANVEYAPGGYGAYNPNALNNDSYVQGVVINLNWSSVETARGFYNWGPLDTTATAWANKGKHIVLVVRAANETSAECSAGPVQILPGWEITALHNALGSIGTFCDKRLDILVPDWFSSAFQSNFQGFISALGAHVSAQPYYSSISYVRVGDGLGGEGFYLMPDNAGSGCSGSPPAPACQQEFSADKAWMVKNWGYTPQAWENFQETMLAAYDAAFPPPVQLIYAIAQQDIAPDGNPVDYNVAEWATTHYSNIGIGEECLAPGGLGGYADFGTIDTLVRDNNPHAYIQFQTCGQTTTASEEQGIIDAAEDYGAKSIEWYENTIVNPPSAPDMTAYQTWVNNTFGG
jgi:hypothetical protein